MLKGATGADLVQPILDRLAEDSGELVRLGVIDGERQTWIAKSQGARSGLRYDPDMGRDAPLFYTASGHAWLACMSDAEALSLVERQAAEVPVGIGPNAPRSNIELLERLRLARERHATVQAGEFGAEMQVHLVNDGPVTIPITLR